MLTCTKKGCDKSATTVVKLLLFTENCTTPAEVFATIAACCEEHQTADGDIRLFFESNWEILATGFEQRGFPRPVLELTQFGWLPVEDYEEFQRQHDGADAKSKKLVTIN
jgi:hypothetical protein